MNLQTLEVVAYRMKLKPNSLEKIKAWGQKLTTEYKEVVKLLSDEGIIVESAFLERTSEGDFLIYYLRAKDLKKARETSLASTHPIDIFHKQVMSDVIESVVVLENLLDICSE